MSRLTVTLTRDPGLTISVRERRHCPASLAVLVALPRSPPIMRLLLWVPLLASNSLEMPSSEEEHDDFQQSPSMVIHASSSSA